MLKYLEKLGKTQKEIVANLLKQKYFGEKENGESCPISLFLQKKTKRDVYVDDYYAYYDGGQGDEVVLPKCIKKFVENFDKGKYPQLVRKTND